MNTKKDIFYGLAAIITGKDCGVLKPKKTKPAKKAEVAESLVLDQCRSWLTRHRIAHWRNNTGSGDLRGTGRWHTYGIVGGGDIIGCINGRYFEVECKHGHGGKWSVEQQQHAEAVRNAGGKYYIVHSAEELAEYFEPLLPGLFL